MVVDTDRDSEFHHALGQGVHQSSRQNDLDSEFHHAFGQGVDKSSRHLEGDRQCVINRYYYSMDGSSTDSSVGDSDML